MVIRIQNRSIGQRKPDENQKMAKIVLGVVFASDRVRTMLKRWEASEALRAWGATVHRRSVKPLHACQLARQVILRKMNGEEVLVHGLVGSTTWRDFHFLCRDALGLKLRGDSRSLRLTYLEKVQEDGQRRGSFLAGELVPCHYEFCSGRLRGCVLEATVYI